MNTESDPQAAMQKSATMDTDLTEFGWSQCREKQELAQKLDFDIVLISPLRRTLETAHCIFKKHPNFQQIRFVLAPLAREIVDIPANITETIAEFAPLFPNGLDTSNFDGYGNRERWVLEHMSA
jgi:broad specificity phosphatase PhoE